ncbi:DUF5667 domain-containing protein [Desulfosporosinus meridiei]|uniref:DUF5667 domain-containing protein n=1 Tax=Desulfosporosinus meridiei (strain ATCC BAA-275 / DSM 13257 / KCTC 12902 / NCIMB 13706 / S10) TaxID=768704 RepID=J7J4N3_DESMD|nr:DUF5667 domain-containing protein [Desulfosporosinus meridiei]AFQ45901.1 hypothetical protein Desmer_4070 [Desulfosporosinus meridiei DSM 13257]
MRILSKKIALALTLALCVMPLSGPLALAETVVEQSTSEEILEPNSVETSEEVIEPGSNEDTATDSEVTEETEGDTVPDTSTDTDTGEVPDSLENEEDLPPVLDENGEEVTPGTLPDSPFYWLTTLVEKLQVALTFDPAKKTELLADQALERIAEAGALIEEGNAEEAEVALIAYSEKVAEAQAFLASLTETESETIEKLETALSKTHANNIQTLGGLIDKLPPQAAQKVALNVVRSMEKSIAKMEKKDQLKVATELRKAIKGLEENELTEEDAAALEGLEETLDLQEDRIVEEEQDSVEVASGSELNTMTVMTETDTSAAKSNNSSKFILQNADSKAIKVKAEPKTEAKAAAEMSKQQAQELQLKDEVEKKSLPKEELKGGPEDKAKSDTKAPEQKQTEDQKVQDSKLKAEQMSGLKDTGSNNSVQKQSAEKTQKASKESSKGEKSGGKDR